MTTGQEAATPVLRLMEGVQAFGLVSAATVVDRYIEIVDRALGRNPLGDPLIDTAGRMAEVWARSFTAAAAVLLDGTGPEAGTPTVEAVTLTPARPGSSSEVSLWVHNPTAAPVTVGLHVTRLVSSDGLTIPPRAVILYPERVERIDPLSRCEVRLRVTVPTTAQAGRYHGLVLSSVVAAEPVALRLQVLAQEGLA